MAVRKEGPARPLVSGAEVSGLGSFVAASVVVVALALGLIGVLLWENWAARERALTEVRSTAHHEAQILAEFGARTVDIANLALLDLAEELQERGLVAPGAGAFRQKRMLNAMPHFPALTDISYHDAEGRLLEAVGGSDSEPNIAERAYFKEHRDGAVESMISVPEDGNPLHGIRVSRRVTDANGKFSGTISATIDREAFSSALDFGVTRRVDSAAFATRSGVILAAWPGSVLTSRSDRLLASDIDAFSRLSPASLSATGMRVLDDGPTTVAVMPVRNAPFHAIVGIEKDRILAQWHADSWRIYAIIVAIMAAVGIAGIILSYRQAMRRALVEEAIRLRDQVVQDSSDGIVIVRVDGNEPVIAFANPAFEKITRYRRDDVIGKSPRFLYRNDVDQPGVVALRRALRERSAARFDIRAFRNGDEAMWAEMSLAPINSGPDLVGHMVITLTDVTARRTAEEIARRREAILSAVVLAVETLLKSDNWEEAFPRVMEGVGVAAETGCVSLFEWCRSDDGGRRVLRARAEWCGRDRTPVLTNPLLGEFSAEAFSGTPLMRALRSGEVVKVDRETEAGRLLLSRFGFVSMLIIPVVASGETWGAMFVDENCCRAGGRDATEIAALQVAADVLGAAVHQSMLRQQLQTDEERFNRAVEAGKVGIWEWKPNNGALFISPNLRSMVGFGPEETVDRMEIWSRRFHPDDHHVFADAVSAHFDGRAETIACEHRMLGRDGSVIWFLVRGGAERAGDGSVVRVVGSCLDITDRKRTEQALIENEARLAEAQKIGRLGHWEVFPATGELRSSSEVYRIFEIPVGTPLSLQSFQKSVHPDDAKKLSDLLSPISWDPKTQTEFDFRYLRPSGEVRHVNARIEVRRNRGGSSDRVLGTFQDVTDRKENEAALVQAKIQAERANVAKSNFLAHMSHELRTPLNSVIGFSDMMVGEILGPLGDRKYREYAQDINASGQHLLEVINDILDVSRIEAGVADMHETDIDLHEIVGACSVIVRERITESELTFVSDLPDDLPRLRGDVRRIRQILLNLLSNAVKFTESGGTVGVRARVGEDGGVMVTVFDDGIGIDSHDIPLVLEPFGQARNPLTRRRQGTGLGLTITRALVELHDGDMTLTSSSGQGTAVELRFPRDRTVLAPVEISALDASTEDRLSLC